MKALTSQVSVQAGRALLSGEKKKLQYEYLTCDVVCYFAFLSPPLASNQTWPIKIMSNIFLKFHSDYSDW